MGGSTGGGGGARSGGGIPPAPPGGGQPPGEPPDAARLDRELAAWARSLTARDRAAIRRYQWEGGAINDYLRGVECPLEPDLEADVDDLLDLLDGLVSRGRLAAPVTVYRGIGNAGIARFGAGGFTESGFSSTSLSRDAVADYPLLLEFVVPAGASAAWLALAGDPFYRGEFELLLPRGVLFTFMDVRDEGGTVIVRAEIS